MKVMNMNMNKHSMNMTWIWISCPWIWISGSWIWMADVSIHMNMSCMNYFTFGWFMFSPSPYASLHKQKPGHFTLSPPPGSTGQMLFFPAIFHFKSFRPYSDDFWKSIFFPLVKKYGTPLVSTRGQFLFCNFVVCPKNVHLSNLLTFWLGT